jgi:hypothetical protein
MTTTYLDINGIYRNNISLYNINGKTNYSNPIYMNYFGEVDYAQSTIAAISDFLRISLNPVYLETIDSIEIENNEEIFTLQIYTIYNDTVTIDTPTIKIVNPNNNTVLVFTELTNNNIQQFSGINYNEFTKQSFFIKIYKIENDELVIPTQLENITITIPNNVMSYNTNKIKVDKYNDDTHNLTSSRVIKKDMQNNFIFTISSTSTYLISSYYDWFIGHINIDQGVLLYYKPLDPGPDTYYHIPIQYNLYQLFSNYNYIQNNIESIILNFTYDISQLNSILEPTITSPGIVSPLEQGALANSATYKENGSINGITQNKSNFNLRFLEIAAIHIFGHAKAQAAIRNDTVFNQIGSIIKQAIFNNFDNNTKYNFFEQYVGSGRYVNSNDVDSYYPLNFEGASIRYKIEFTIDNIFDSASQLTQITNENHMWTTNITLDFIHNGEIPRIQ